MTEKCQILTTKMGGGLTVESWPIEKPIPYARNARVCPESAIAKVAASITRVRLAPADRGRRARA